MNTTQLNILMKSPFFTGLSVEEVKEILFFGSFRITSFTKDALIHQEGDYTNEMGIVLKGNVRIERIDYQGKRNILSNVGVGQSFAETYAFLENEPLMVDVVAGSNCEVLFINLKRVVMPATMENSWHATLVMNLLNISTRKNLELSHRNFHTSSKHIRGRVWSYLMAQSRQRKAEEFEIPFNRQQMADYLNLDRSALSGELSKMREEGIIDFHKNHFRILSKDFF